MGAALASGDWRAAILPSRGAGGMIDAFIEEKALSGSMPPHPAKSIRGALSLRFAFANSLDLNQGRLAAASVAPA
jgi:hypothetical protein